MSRIPIMQGLYSIKAEPKVKQTKLGRKIENFDASLAFVAEPTPEEVLDVLKLLRPGTEYFLGSVRVKYIKDIIIN